MRRILLTLLIAISSVLAIQAQGDVTGGATVVRAEYFFDSDPGYGNATIINNVTSGDNNLSLSVDGLSPGAHMLYVRSQASSGVWSSTQSHPLLLIRQRPTEAVRVEYFYDTDPGYGNGKSVGNLVDGDNTLVFSVEGLAYGVHHLCLRAQDNTGVWSQVATSSIFVASPKTANAVRIEYFFDTDPGYGQATAITPSQDETATYALSLDNLSMDAHMLYLRVQDNHGRWSAVQKHPIYVLSNLPDVVAAEYFFDDNDPGEGQATAVPLPSVKTEPFAFEANTEGLAPGEHHLKVRLKKNNGFWTLYDAATFTVEGVAEPEPYAVLNEDNTVLTFYYDDQKAARNGMDVGPFSGYPDDQTWYAQRESITSVVFDTSFAGCTTLTSTAYWFYGLKNLTSITGISNLRTDNVTDMYGMFYICSGLTSLDVSGFKTDNVTDMSWMFADCQKLTSLDLGSFKTDNVTNMKAMFDGCSILTSIYVSSEWTTASVTEGSNMFRDCTNLVGGQGTTYDANHTDYTYAHIDGGTSNPGFLTLTLAMGDANGDGSINIADAVATVTNILGQPTEGNFYKYAADMNTDNVIDIFDVTMIVNAAFEASSPAPALTRGSAGNIMMENVSITADADYFYLAIDQPERFTATQFDVTLPEGMELVDAKLSSPTTDHQLSFVKRGENEYRVIALSMSNATFRSMNSQLIKLKVSGSAVDCDVKLGNVLFVTPTAMVMTSIDKCLNTVKAADDSLYDLNGCKMDKNKQQLDKGIYIMNHKKVIIK